MKNLFIILLALSLVAFSSNISTAQITSGNPHFSKGQIDVNVGLGIGSTFNSGLKTGVPPVSVSGEYGINDNISLGGFFAFTRFIRSWNRCTRT